MLGFRKTHRCIHICWIHKSYSCHIWYRYCMCIEPQSIQTCIHILQYAYHMTGRFFGHKHKPVYIWDRTWKVDNLGNRNINHMASKKNDPWTYCRFLFVWGLTFHSRIFNFNDHYRSRASILTYNWLSWPFSSEGSLNVLWHGAPV